jgi:pimeloyl-ACP methyl ester carboxylesterase
MGEPRSDWKHLFAIACDLLDQVRAATGDYPFGWSFGGGTALMLQIGHRDSHDVDIFIDDLQILGFLDPAKADLRFLRHPAGYGGDGARFQRFAFEGVGEIDFIVSASVTSDPFRLRLIEGRETRLETVTEIIAKKVFHRGGEAKPRDIFDIAAAARTHRDDVIAALRPYPQQVDATLRRLDVLNRDFVDRTIAQLMILPDYRELAPQSIDLAGDVLREAMA